jgi:ribonuclease HII
MAASIIAKVYRDNMMIKLAEQFPAYDWASNKGYGSSKHIDAIKKQGYSELHRLSYKLK